MMLMDSREIHRRANVFLTDTVAQLKRLPSDAIRAWPEFPPSPSINLNVPQELLEAKCEFRLMKDTHPSGDVQIAIQYRRYRFLGISQMMADGFVITAA